MEELKIVPDGWPKKLGNCPPGFFVYDGSLCFKSSYNPDEVFCGTGEIFWGDTEGDMKKRSDLVVQPVVAVWEFGKGGSE